MTSQKPVTSQKDTRTARLAAAPLVPAGPVSGFIGGTADSVRGVWRYRELLDLLVKRELKSRYKDSALGFLWSLIRPLTQLLIYYIAIGQFLGAARSIPDFAIYIFTGLTAWGLFSEIVSTGTGSIVANGGLVKKIYLPREVFPLSVIGSAFFNFVIQLVILLVAALIASEPPSLLGWGYVLLGTVLLLIYATAAAFLLSAINVYLRDVQYLVEVALMVGFWLSPIVYAWSFVHDALHSQLLNELYLANPVTLAVLAFQRGIWVAGAGVPQPADLGVRILIAIAIGLPLLWLCQRVFARLQSNFAQEL
ncbi:ABC transporter permease [Nakamurella sp.]|uniref:ABC transporter permease n=1 Tax=Nakamurella sp. TaxID=1869182 RepID=UPI003B3B8319